MKNELYNSEQVADYFHVRVETIRDWTRRGILKGFKAGRDWRYSQQNLDDCMKALQEQTEEMKQTLEQRIPGLSAMLEQEEAAFWANHKEEWLATKQWTLDFLENNPGMQVHFDPKHGLMFGLQEPITIEHAPESEKKYTPELSLVRP
jgi:Helix-turn-helix domain